jgi:N utilization substance protein B
MKRHTMRRHIFSMLFRAEFYDREDLTEQDRLYMDSIEPVEPEQRAYMEEKTRAIVERLPEIDARIESNAKGWKLERIGKVELTILRLAVYEIEYDDDIPANVAVNEAVELAKTFGGENAPAFVNGILGKML